MRFSCEIRWFMPGSAPADVLEWVDALGPVTKMPPRTDYHADLGASATASVKLRADRLEFKSLCPPPPRLWRFGSVTGFQNHWLKWSGAAADAAQYDAVAEGSQWLAVWKSRSMRRFAALRGAVDLLEADGDLDDILRLAANIQLSPPPPAALAKQSSKSYPGWLALCRACEWPGRAMDGGSAMRATGTERR